MNLPRDKALRFASLSCFAALTAAIGIAQTVPDISRWSGNTALAQPQGYSLGSPLTLTWGFVTDGTLLGGGGNSNLISTFDATYGNGGGGSDLTNRPWFTPFANSFNRWSQLAGLSYQYSAADDGIAQDSNNPGILGVRGDVRIGGKNIDGPSGTLAYNYFPNFGEMVIDTADMALYSNAANNYRFLRNVVMHEHGHGMGCPHCESSNAAFLMEPFINTNFDGPQYHDILLAQRGYGDVNEKSFSGLGNDVFTRATSLGAINVGGTASVGNDARDLAVGGSEVDFVSIDDQTDTDFFSFSVAGAGMVNVLLESLGQTYNIANQGGTQAPWNTDLRSDLALALYGTDGTTLLSSANLTGLGGNEQVNFNLGSGGTYYLRVTGLDNADAIAVDTQFYALSVQVVPEPGTIAALGLGAALLARRRRRRS